MKIKKEEEIKDEVIEREEIKKENIEKEEEEDEAAVHVVLQASFRASLSRFANPSSPPSTTRAAPPKRPPDSNPNPSSSASLPVTVAVARPTTTGTTPGVTVRRQDEGNIDGVPSDSPAVQDQALVLLRRSTRKRKKSTRQSFLDAGDENGEGDDGRGDVRPSKKMKKKIRRGEPARAPEVDLSHLGALPEYLAEDLDVLFCGINPGRTSGIVGHHYANGTNHFWPCLHLSGFTPLQLPANEDSTLPEIYNLGLTNLVERASISSAQLLNREMSNSVPALLAKIARWRPRVMCFNGKGIWLHVERSFQQQLIQRNGSDGSAATGSRVLEPKREVEEELKPIIPDMGQERPVKTEQVTARSLQQPPLKKDTSNDRVATKPRVPVTRREGEECKPSVADTEQERKRRGFASGAGNATANSSNLDAGRVLRSSTSAAVTVGRRSEISSQSSPVTPRRVATTTQSTFVYGIQPYKAVHDVPNDATVRETLFCVFPSSSGRVVSHQRKDKVVLFKKLREDLEIIKAGTFDTSSMQLVNLVPEEE